MKINKLMRNEIPERLQRISSPPKQLFTLGASLDELLQRKSVAIVGSRKVTTYGRQVTGDLAGKLAGQGIVIISGLALGVDAIAHQAALDAGGLTIAVLPGPVETVYPASHRQLAKQIVEQGGALVSEYAIDTPIAYAGNFIARNRLVSGLSDALLITEAAEKSGSLHTARFALEQGKDVLAVPGNITVLNSIGTNNLLKSGATPITNYVDALHVLGLQEHDTKPDQIYGRNPQEQKLLDLMVQGVSDGEELQFRSKLDVQMFNQSLTMLEITGKIRSLGANRWAIA